MNEDAVILKSDGSPSSGRNVAKVLDFFGIPWRRLTVTEFLTALMDSREINFKARLFCPASTLLELLTTLEGKTNGFGFWREKVHSAFVHAERDADIFCRLTQKLTGDDAVTVKEASLSPCDFIVSDREDDLCGALSGLRITPSRSAMEHGFIVHSQGEQPIKVIRAGDGAIFLKANYHNVPIFLSGCSRVVDLDADLPTGIFDVREHFGAAVPIVLYVRCAFGNRAWNSADLNACLIVDDPLLKPDYGFVNFRELLSLMQRHSFSTNIAFIPWNWKRSNPEVALLFRENPKEFSLSVHGCDHTRGEFGSRDRQHLYWKVRQGMERMARHESKTGIHHDPVMVFPQGVFSNAAMSALKHTGLIGAVNNDTISSDPRPRSVRISDVWDVAIMGYSCFPLFTRRYPWEGVENFAFDMMLGKPCIAIIHHDFCRDGCLGLVEFVDKINALKPAPSWESLGTVIRRSCRQREVSPNTLELEMYGTELAVKNRSGQRKRYRVSRRESDPAVVRNINAGGQTIPWKTSEDRIHWEMELEPGEEQTFSVMFQELNSTQRAKDKLSYRAKTMLRRYLCEMRDNYIIPILSSKQRAELRYGPGQ